MIDEESVNRLLAKAERLGICERVAWRKEDCEGVPRWWLVGLFDIVGKEQGRKQHFAKFIYSELMLLDEGISDILTVTLDGMVIQSVAVAIGPHKYATDDTLDRIWRWMFPEVENDDPPEWEP